jgi:hypothetical protein
VLVGVILKPANLSNFLETWTRANSTLKVGFDDLDFVQKVPIVKTGRSNIYGW